jgi:prepilin-type N-terminal cleavage/methylation domain-containing protein/prepilin-type processing-associated H-X9-DG protein
MEKHMHPSRQTRAKFSRFALTNAPARGFTLIEVLVVVAIMALLVSILLPSLSKARAQAKIAACLANLHDFGSSHHQYAHSNDPYFPLPVHAGSSIGVGINSVVIDDNLFVLYQFKYAKSPALWNCPAKSYTVRAPEVVAKATVSVPGVTRPKLTNASMPGGGTISLPPKDLIRYNITTGGTANRSDFREIGQKDPAGFGSSYEYHGWSICGRLKGQQTANNWHPDHYGSLHWGGPKTTRTGQPTPQYAMMMHDADDDSVVGYPLSTNDTPEPWDNHGVGVMNLLFADGHSASIRNFDLTPPPSSPPGTRYTMLNQIWKRNDCNQVQQLPDVQPWP